MRAYEFQTVDVFTDRKFGGNPLAVFPEAAGLAADQMQSLAAEFNLSETVFMLPPQDAANTARMRIFNRTAEMAFAGHPSIGAAFVLARSGRERSPSLTLEAPAGLVRIALQFDEKSKAIGAVIEAPQALSIGEFVSAELVASCLGLRSSDVATTTHPPVIVSVGNPYVMAELNPDALRRCEPEIAIFRQALALHPSMNGRFSVFVYAREGGDLRARMFAPLAGTWEDPATGSASAPLGAFLLSLSTDERMRLVIRQGVEMGRASLLVVEAWRLGGEFRASVGGQCVPVFKGTVEMQLETTALTEAMSHG